MKTIKIAEAQDMVGMVLPCIEGTLTAIYDQKTGEKDGKPWAMQNGMIQDETGSMKIVFSGHEAISLLMKGQPVRIEAFTSKQHGLVGIKVKENTWKEKTTKEIWVTGTAKINFPNAHQPEDDGTPEDLKPKSTIVLQPKSDLIRIDPNVKAVDRVGEFCNLYKICLASAESLPISDHDVEGARQVATAFFIQSVREGLEKGL